MEQQRREMMIITGARTSQQNEKEDVHDINNHLLVLYECRQRTEALI